MPIPFGCCTARARAFLLAAIVLALVLSNVAAASAADPRLEKAQAKKQEIQERLDELNKELETTRAAVDQAETELDRLQEQTASWQESASAAERMRTRRIRESYMRGNGDPILGLLTAEDPTEVIEQARFMAWMSSESREDFERAHATAVRTRSLADHTAAVAEELSDRKDELAEQQAETEKLFDEAVQAEKDIEKLIAKEKAAAARRAAAAARASRSNQNSSGGGSAGAAGTVSGGVACPVGSPRTYIDSWGAARSGGRSHKGTDILAPRGTPTPAYESGVISRLSSNSLGGISLYLRGDSGNVYYYTHLSGYAGVSVGQRVSAGQVIAYVGATGNARGINHLHFEVRPGGGGNVNPYPYVRRACG